MSGLTLNILVTAMLTGQPYNQARLGKQAKDYARKITNRTCRDFPEDRHEEVAQQALMMVWEMGPAALVGTTGQALFRRAVFLAIRVVRSDYAAPGQRTRRPAKGAPPKRAPVAAEDIGRIADAQTLERVTLGEGDQSVIDFDLIESPEAKMAIRACDDRIELDWALRRAAPQVADALRLICVDGESLSFAAGEAQLSRFALSRRLDAYCPDWRLAA